MQAAHQHYRRMSAGHPDWPFASSLRIELNRARSVQAKMARIKAAIESFPMTNEILQRVISAPLETKDALAVALCDSLCGAQFWRAAFGVYPHCHNPDYSAFERMFARERAHWSPAHMAPADQAAYLALGNEVTLFRGQMTNRPLGLSWTQSLVTARFFATDYRPHPDHRGVILAARIFRSDIAALLTERGEGEALLFDRNSAWILSARDPETDEAVPYEAV
jgi:hypothetical protein